MCTVTWRHAGPAGHLLYANRDIGADRAAARAPSLLMIDGVRVITPVELIGGGTWIGANEHGLSVALLNEWYEHGATPTGGKVSRGSVVWRLLSSQDTGELAARLEAMALESVNPFQLVALDRISVRGFRFRPEVGLSPLHLEPARGILTSSSFRTGEVLASRRALFAGFEPADHLDFHRSHRPARGAYSVCMHRDDAQTVCFSRVEVTPGAITFDHHPAAPCASGPWERTEISLPPAT